MNKTINARVGQRAKGRVKIQILQNGRIIEDRPWQNNLILNQGLNNVCSVYTWADASLYCAAGSGTTPTNSASGGGNTGSGASTTFTGPGAVDFTTQSSVGDMIQMTSGASSGVEVRITSITDATHVEYTPAGTINAGEFTIWRTSQTGLTTELKRTNNYLTGTGNCGSSFASSTLTHRRTYDFTAEVGAVTYNEVGFSNVATVASNLFSRILLASPVNLVASQQLRVIYDLDITFSPTTPLAQTFNISGWPVAPSTTTDGDCQMIRPGLSGVLTTGLVTAATTGWDNAQSDSGGNCLEPSVTSGNPGIGIFLSPSSAALEAFAGNGAQTNRSTNAVENGSAPTTASYTALSFFRDKSYTFTVGEGNRTDFRSLGIGFNKTATTIQQPYTNTAFVCLFDEAQTKDSLHTLTLNFRITVGRVLA